MVSTEALWERWENGDVRSAIKLFRILFPKGCKDPAYEGRESGYKKLASKYVNTFLTKEKIACAIESGDYCHIWEKAEFTISMTRLTDGAHSSFRKFGRHQENKKSFVHALYKLLSASSSSSVMTDEIIENLLQALDSFEGTSSTIATYFPFLMPPKNIWF